MQGLDQQVAARSQQAVQVTQGRSQRIFEQGEVAHQQVEAAQLRRIGDQMAAFDTPFTHRRCPGIGIGLPAEAELLTMIALHGSTPGMGPRPCK
jgi:hypothetical protein